MAVKPTMSEKKIVTDLCIRAPGARLRAGGSHLPPSPCPGAMARGTLTLAAVAALFVGANAGAVDLTQDNFDAKVFGEGKAAFIKFLAPW